MDKPSPAHSSDGNAVLEPASSRSLQFLHKLTEVDTAAAFYRDHGFVGFADVFDNATLLSLRESIERAVHARSSLTDPFFRRLDEENSFNGNYRQYANLHEQDDALRAFVHSELLGGVAQNVARERLAFLFSSMLEKKPFAGALRAHHDLRQMPFETASMITAWIPLDDVDVKNGCLYYLPGTHLMGVTRAKDSAFESFKDSSIDYLRFYSEFKHVMPVFAEVPRGALLLHNGIIIHGSSANLSRAPRTSLSVSFVPIETTCTNPEHPLLREVCVNSRLSDSSHHPRALPEGY